MKILTPPFIPKSFITRHLRRLFSVAIALVLVAFSLQIADAQSTPVPTTPNYPHGTVTGHITNGTAASTVPSNLIITLVVSQGNNTPIQLTGPIQADDSFTINDVPIIPDADYVAAVLYRDHVFNSAFLKGTAAKLDLPITIYEPTEDPSVISIIGTVIQVGNDGTALEFSQVVRFRNTSDRIFTSSQDVGDGRYASVVVPLPPGAQVISFDNPNRYVVSQDKFTIIDTAPVFPGDDNQILVVYIIPYNGSPSLIEQPFNYAFDGEARVLVWPETLGMKSDQFPAIDKETLADKEYQAYGQKLSLKPGDVIRYEISGSDSGSNSSTPAATAPAPNNGVIALVIIIVLALVAVGVLLVLRARQTAAPTTGELIDALNRQIEALDRKHKAGQLNHDIWRRQRAPLQARLNQLTGDSKGEQ